MRKIKHILEDAEIDSRFTFNLQRRTGEKIYLNHGNEMVSANDRLHHAPKAILIAHLRELGESIGQNFREKNNMEKGSYLYTEENPCHIIAVIHPPTLARMDAPNWYPTIKGLIDGIADAGIFSDDNDRVVKSITFIPGEKTQSGKYSIELNIVKGEEPLTFRQLTFEEALEEIK